MLCKDTMHGAERRPAARPARSRRGSAIILAVGALVLLSVISLVYWGIGRADVRTAVASIRSSSVDETVNQVADYLSNVISRDKLAWFVEKARTSSDPPGSFTAVNTINRPPMSNGSDRAPPFVNGLGLRFLVGQITLPVAVSKQAISEPWVVRRRKKIRSRVINGQAATPDHSLCITRAPTPVKVHLTLAFSKS